MPKTLQSRFRAESIREFQQAAVERYFDGLALAAAGRRTGAIYMWGYAAEMILKAAVFKARGFAGNQAISLNDLNAASKGAGSIVWPKRATLHCARCWGQLLVQLQNQRANPRYTAAFSQNLQQQAAEVSRHWQVEMRYHKNVAYEFELRRVDGAAKWFITQANNL